MRIQRLPNPISSFWRGLKAGSSKIEKATNRIIGSVGHFSTSTPKPPHVPAETLVKSDEKLNNVTTAVESKEEDSPESRQLVITSGSHSSQTTNGHGSNYYSSNSHSQILNGEVVESSYESSLDDVYNAQYNNKKTSQLGLLLFDRIQGKRLTFVSINLNRQTRTKERSSSPSQPIPISTKSSRSNRPVSRTNAKRPSSASGMSRYSTYPYSLRL